MDPKKINFVFLRTEHQENPLKHQKTTFELFLDRYFANEAKGKMFPNWERSAEKLLSKINIFLPKSLLSRYENDEISSSSASKFFYKYYFAITWFNISPDQTDYEAVYYFGDNLMPDNFYVIATELKDFIKMNDYLGNDSILSIDDAVSLIQK